MGFKLRDLRMDDLDAAVQLIVETWHDSYRGLIPDEKLDRMTIENLRPGWKVHLESNPHRIHNIGIFENDSLLGVCGVGKAREALGYDCELWAMNVPLRSQRRGVGRALMQESLRRMKDLGHRSLYLYCIDQNQKALAFYQAMGGRLDGRSAQREGYREVVLHWSLN